MDGANASIIALVTAVTVLGVGWLGAMVVRSGFDYAASRGNPRNRAQAHEALWDIAKGAILIAAPIAIAAFLVATLRFG